MLSGLKYFMGARQILGEICVTVPSQIEGTVGLTVEHIRWMLLMGDITGLVFPSGKYGHKKTSSYPCICIASTKNVPYAKELQLVNN